MIVNVIGVLFVLDSEKNENIRKNDVKKIKLLVSNDNNLPIIKFDGSDMKESVRNYFSKLIGSEIFHLEQVYTYGYSDRIDVVFLAVTNMEYIKKLDATCKLIDFNVSNNEVVTLGESNFKYKTVEKLCNNSIEYFHDIKVNDEDLRIFIQYILVCYKKVRSNIDNTDILFKFMGSVFTLEDVRNVYELVKDTTVDKSNFRKKIVKYCEEVEVIDEVKSGFRPSQKYKFKPLKGDVWL